MTSQQEERNDYILTVKDVAKELKVSRETLYQWRKIGRDPLFKKCDITGKVRYSASSVVEIKYKILN